MSEDYFKNATYEEKMTILYSKMSEKEQKNSREQVIFMSREYCGKCPSNAGTGEENLAFCIMGKSTSIKEKRGCLCKQCPIAKMMSLRWEYYCTEGSATEFSQAGK